MKKSKRIKIIRISSERKILIRKILFCIFAIGITGIPAIFMNNILGYLPCLTVVLAILFSFIYMLILKRTISYEEMSDLTDCRRGAEIEFVVKIRNRFLLVYPKVELFFYISDIFGRDDTITNSVVTLAPRENRVFDFSVRFDHIGTYSAGLKKIIVSDLLGLFTHEITNAKEYQVDVTPKIFDVRDLEISKNTMVESQKMVIPTVVEGYDYTGVREYVMGDPMKRIHWKLSARTEVYMTKQYENYAVPGINIIIDLFAPEYGTETLMDIFDGVVETALSIVEYASENGIDYELIYTDKRDDKQTVNTVRSIEYVELIQDMGRVTVSTDINEQLALLRDEFNNMYSHGNVALCTSNLKDEVIDLLMELKSLRKNPILFAVLPKDLTDEEKEEILKPLRILESANISYFVLTSAKDLGGGEKR